MNNKEKWSEGLKAFVDIERKKALKKDRPFLIVSNSIKI
jgi:hypothetical protein